MPKHLWFKLKAMRFFERRKNEVNCSSMADIAFLLLIFFLVTTTIQSDKGLNVTLPPHTDQPTVIEISERNLFKVHINSKNQLLVEDAPFAGFETLHDDARRFILNNGQNPDMSDNPKDAIISVQMNRGTHYKKFIETMDVLQGVYYGIYGERVGLSADEFRNLDLTVASEKAKYENGRDGIPMNISIAEPQKVK
jgi:biopolymer transport protein ExbD